MTKAGFTTMIGGLIAAFFASLCCIGPFVLAALSVGIGATGFWADTVDALKGIVPYRPVFIGLAVFLLGVSFYLAYGRPKPALCAPGGVCVPGGMSGANRTVLWVMAVLTLVLLLAPYWLEVLTR